MFKKANVFLLFLFASLYLQANNYFADPSILGNIQNAGSATSPWPGLQSIFAAGKVFNGGDTIFLRNGNHGYPIIVGVNSGYVVITPEAGQTPVLSGVRISNGGLNYSASNWKLLDLTFQGESTGTLNAPSNIIDIYGYASNIIISGCTISSSNNVQSWTRDDWRLRAANGIMERKSYLTNPTILIENNIIENVAGGAFLGAINTTFINNIVRNFSRDATRINDKGISFIDNKVYDLIKVMCYYENHDDLLQLFGANPNVDTLDNITISKNIFVCCTDTNRAFRGPIQGIGSFNSIILNSTIENNIIMNDQWHGITLVGAQGCKIINNTVLDPYAYTPYDTYDTITTQTHSMGPSWIMISDDSVHAHYSFNNIVENNLVAYQSVVVTVNSNSVSNNIVGLGSLQSGYLPYFTDVNDFTYPMSFDLHLKPGCSAIDGGTSFMAPSDDYDGVLRPQGSNYDIGAYEAELSTYTMQDKLVTSRLIVYPNPCSGVLKVKTTNLKTDEFLKIISLATSHVFFKRAEIKNDIIEVDVSDLERGGYLLTVGDYSTEFIVD